jgi:3-oxoacyl-[acyl-carrier protein] reductase
MSGRLAGRTAIVTGGGRGIGESIARRFAAEGARVLIATRTEAHGALTIDAIRQAGGEAELITVEMGSREASRAIVARAQALWGGLDIVVHNAGFAPHGPLVDTDEASYRRAMDVGVNTALWLMQDAHPLLKESDGGRVILTSSIMADRNNMAGLATYSTVKGAINALIRAAAVELGPDGITVNGVAPGGTRSVSFDAGMPPGAVAAWEKTIPLRRIGTGDDIAGAMLYLASADAAYVTGQVIIVDGGQALGMQLELTGH